MEGLLGAGQGVSEHAAPVPGGGGVSWAPVEARGGEGEVRNPHTCSSFFSFGLKVPVPALKD